MVISGRLHILAGLFQGSEPLLPIRLYPTIIMQKGFLAFALITMSMHFHRLIFLFFNVNSHFPTQLTSTMKMAVAFPFETLVLTYQTTECQKTQYESWYTLEENSQPQPPPPPEVQVLDSADTGQGPIVGLCAKAMNNQKKISWPGELLMKILASHSLLNL